MKPKPWLQGRFPFLVLPFISSDSCEGVCDIYERESAGAAVRY